MANSLIPPPWIKTKAGVNIAKRARLAAILRRKAAAKRTAELAAIAKRAR